MTQANEQQLQTMAAEYSKLAAEAAEKEENSTKAISDLQQRKQELEVVVAMQRRQISELNTSLAIGGEQFKLTRTHNRTLTSKYAT